MSEQVAAHLVLVDSSTVPPTKETFLLHMNHTLKFGRDSKSNDHVISDNCVALNHLEFYSIKYQNSDQAMIYVRVCQSFDELRLNGRVIGYEQHLSSGWFLRDGDEVTIKPFWSFRIETTSYGTAELSSIQQLEIELFVDEYRVTDEIIGEGGSAQVLLAYDQKSGRQLACKIYDLKKLMDCGAHDDFELVMQSVSMIGQMRHPNITSFERAYKSPYTLFIFEEMAPGGDLFSVVERLSELRDLEIRWIMHQVLRGVSYLHANNIAHRDLKLENILCMVCPGPSHRVTITDFGHAAKMVCSKRLTSVCGTLGFQAPEQMTPPGDHGLPIDMWAIGIIAILLLAGSCALHTLEDLERSLSADPSTIDVDKILDELHLIREARSSMDTRLGRECIDRTLPSSAEDFIRDCLVIDETKRMTASQALAHPWIREPGDISELICDREAAFPIRTHRRRQADMMRELHDVLLPPPPKRYNLRRNSTQPDYLHSQPAVQASEQRGTETKQEKLDKKRKAAEISVQAEVNKMSKRQRIKEFGSHGNHGDASLGGRRPSLEHHLWSPDEPNRDERQRNKQRLLAVLKDNPRIPGRSRSCPTVSEEHYDACKGSERRTISGDGDKSRRVVIDESTGRPINFDDPWGF